MQNPAVKTRLQAKRLKDGFATRALVTAPLCKKSIWNSWPSHKEIIKTRAARLYEPLMRRRQKTD
jgi:hypothetical protein